MWKSDQIIALTLVLKVNIVRVITVYIQMHRRYKKFFNLNGHGGKGREGKEDIEGRVLERRMKSEKRFLGFQKHTIYILWNSGDNKSKVDYLFERKEMSKKCEEFMVIDEESVITQHNI